METQTDSTTSNGVANAPERAPKKSLAEIFSAAGDKIKRGRGRPRKNAESSQAKSGELDAERAKQDAEIRAQQTRFVERSVASVLGLWDMFIKRKTRRIASSLTQDRDTIERFVDEVAITEEEIKTIPEQTAVVFDKYGWSRFAPEVCLGISLLYYGGRQANTLIELNILRRDLLKARLKKPEESKSDENATPAQKQ